ncbi:glycosyltransferase family 4 protein [Salegentibacter mishustinae]|uniref:Glycosyl transferase n=1 Tax=Salegentibacter mishustinae TaxID=270918 RepID=A0A0Q9ZH61_9FLAO|nr:glycosyltransferase family 4 protein [Salegentibacter mishustinae]KRG28436.1 glycosyl transferase [Salegentibacter mishustinae]PNW22372.1 glycosyl transferase [Salegentibacter mishustinae]PZX67603.1 glycosyltransferase involved in cell wall biosynthesis [Salegentibacter mishustinae]GGW78617.1 glycoside hydrolase [Salegentibacter mishustinae]
MHLAFLTPEYPHPNSTPSGGLGTSIKNLAEQLVKKDHKISVFIYGQEKDLVFREECIRFHFIKQLNYDFFGWYRYRKYLQSYLNKVILEEKIDAVEAPDWTGITAFIKLKCPLVIRMNGSDSYFCRLEGRSQKKKNFWFEKSGLKNADHLLSVSKFTAEKTREIFKLKKEITVIPNSVDLNNFSPTGEVVIQDSILYFGSIIKKKGVLELAEIFNLIYKKNPNARLIMVGRDVGDIQTGKSTKVLFEDILNEESRGNVSWLGSLPYEKVKAQISKAVVIVLPSFAEALPMTWLEAMAMEKAIVTSDIGWAKEVMIDGETGYTVNPKDHAAYAEKVLTLLSNRGLTEQMGVAARKRVIEKFSTEVTVEKNIWYYESVIS